MKSTQRSLSAWVGKGFWAVMDQGLFATANFALNLLLARWLRPDEYGVYTVTYTVFLLLATLHTAILVEPMLVFGSGKYLRRWPDYLVLLLRGHWRLTAIMGLGLLVAALGLWVANSREVAMLLGALALATPLILFQWLMRRACYVRLEPRLAASAGGLYLILVLLGAYGLYRVGWLRPVTAVALMALASLASALVLRNRLGSEWSPVPSTDLSPDVIRDHWAYGRWAAATSALVWVPGSLYTLVLPLWGGLAAAASLVALFTLLMPAVQMLAALGVVLLPGLVRARKRADFQPMVSRLLGIFILGPLLYSTVVAVTGRSLVAWIYAGKYVDSSWLLWVLGLVPVFTGVVTVLGAALRAWERPERIFWAYACSSIATLTIGLMITAKWGTSGAAMGMALSYGVTALAMGWFYWGADLVVIEPVPKV